MKEEKIKVLLITGTLDIAGAETFLMNLVRAIDKNRFQVDFLLFTTQETRYTREARALGCNIYTIRSRSKSIFGYLSDLNSFFKEHWGEYNAVHFNTGNLTTIAPLRYTAKYGVPVRVVHSHSTSADGLHNRLLHGLHRKFIKRIATDYWACSSGSATFFFGNSPAILIKNGINVPLYQYSNDKRSLIRREFKIPDDAVVIGHVGRFATLKNQSFLIDIFKEYHQLNPNSRLMLVGEGATMETNKQKARNLLGKDSDKIIFAGLRDDINVLMSGFDIFVMPSIYEGLPYVLVEAQASGLPCLISDTINSDSKLTSKLESMSLEEKPVNWAHKIQQLIDNNNRDNSEFMKSGFAMEEIIPYIESIYSRK